MTRLGREEIERIAWEGARVELTEADLAPVAAGRASVRRALAASGRVYGVTTGQGFLADRDLTREEAAAHQRNLLMGRAVGSAPWLPREEARALMAVRLSRFLTGAAGVGPALCRFLADRLDDGFTPAVPREGIGCAGEVIPLAHAFQTLVGVGRVLTADGGVRDAGEALEARGVEPWEPGPKEGIALLAGSPGTTALAIARRRSCARLADQALTAAASSIDASWTPLDAVGPRVRSLAPDPVAAGVLGRLGELLEGAGGERAGAQAPVSFRVVPQLATHLRRTLERLGEDIDRALAAPDDSPALVQGEFTSTGAFHEIELAAAMDAVTAALARTAETAVQRVHRMLDSRVTGLPDQLTPRPGPRCGLVVLHKRAVGAVAALRRLATPASLGVADTSLGQEDAQTFGFAAAEGLRRAEALAAEIVAIELIAARQARWLGDRTPAWGLAPAAEAVAALVPPVDEDRPLGEDVDRVVARLTGGPAL